MRTPLLFLLALAAVAAGAAHAADERARIATERTQAQKAYDARYRECQAQFIVTACVDKARAERRAALEQLSQQQAVLDDAERKQRAAQRAQQIHEKMSQSTAPAQGSASPPLQVKAPRVARAASASPPRAPASAASTGNTEAQRAQHRADYERHQREAVEHREELERRAVDRASRQDKPVAPLPGRPTIPPTNP